MGWIKDKPRWIMSSKSVKFFQTSKNRAISLIYFCLVALIALVLGFLMIFGVISASWLNGFLVSALASAIGLILIAKAWSIVLTTENHYFYLFLLIIRLGIYLIPFFLVFFIDDGQVFNIYGTLVGFLPLVLFPWLTSFNKVLTR